MGTVTASEKHSPACSPEILRARYSRPTELVLGTPVGFLMAEIDLKVASVGEAGASPDKANELPPSAPQIASLGDIWQLGRHRLVGGDALSKEAFEALFGDQRRSESHHYGGGTAGEGARVKPSVLRD